jgi:hypothetical protein
VLFEITYTTAPTVRLIDGIAFLAGISATERYDPCKSVSYTAGKVPVGNIGAATLVPDILDYHTWIDYVLYISLK